jgi:hypothetical protein
MKNVSIQFRGEQKRIGKSRASWHKVYLRNLATDERIEITHLLLEEGGLGVVTDEMERELHGYRSGDVSITCYNIAGGILQSKRDKPAIELAWRSASEQTAAHEAYEDVADSFFMNAAGTGFLDDLTDKIQCEIDTGLDNVPDNVNLFDGLVVHETVKRLDRDLIEFTVRSWDAELTEFNAEEVADTTANPIKNITGLTVNSVAIGGMGGVYKLKFRVDNDNKDWIQFDEGDEVKLSGNLTFDVYNEYVEGHPRRQKIEVTVLDVSDLPAESAEDTLVMIPGGRGNMQVGYWYENEHVKSMVETLYAKAGITGTDVKVRMIDKENADHVFSYFNSEGRTASVNCIGSLGDDLFAFGVGDKLYRVKRQEAESLTYDHIATVDAGTIEKLFVREGDVWLVVGNATAAEIYQYTVTETACTRVNKVVPAETPHYNQVMIHPTQNKIYYVYGAIAGYHYYKYFDMATGAYSSAVKIDNYNKNLPADSGLAVSENSLFFWLELGNYYLVRENLLTFVDSSVMVPYDSAAYSQIGFATAENRVYARSKVKVGVLSPIREGWIAWHDNDTIQYGEVADAWDGQNLAQLTSLGEHVYGFLSGDADLVKLDQDSIHSFGAGFSYTPTGAMVVFDTSKQYLFGIAHLDATHFLAWEFSCRVVPYLITADFTGMNVKQALDECAKTFLCWHKRTGRYSARFYHRDYNVGMFIMGTDQYEQDTPIMMKWEHCYDAVKVTGIDGVWEAGNIAYDSKVLSISTRFIDHAIGQTIAQWHFNFFNSLVPRRLFLTRAIYLPQLEIGDKVVWRREYLAADQAFKFQLLETFDDFALQCVNQLQLKDDVIVMED